MLKEIDNGNILEASAIKKASGTNPSDTSSSATSRSAVKSSDVNQLANTYLVPLNLDSTILAATLNSIDDAVIATDTSACITLLNPAAQKLTGWTQSEAIGRPVDEIFYIINSETWEPIIAPALETIAQGITIKLPKHSLLTSRDGNEHLINLNCAPIINTNNKIEGAVMVFRDISYQESTQEVLRASEELFRTIFENASVGIAHVAHDGQLLRVNQQFCHMVGYPADELMFNKYQTITHPNDIAENEAGYERMLAGEIDRFSMEKRYIRKDGSILWTDLEVGCARDANHEIQYFIAVVEDISARKQAVEDSRRFFTLSQELLCTAGFDGYFKKLNNTWEAALGYSIEELLAKPYLEFVHPDDREISQNIVSTLVNGHNTSAFENRLLCKDGSVRWLLWSTVSVLDEQLLYASARDITERKKAEQDLQLRSDQFECLLNAALYGIYMVDDNFRVRHANHYALNAFNNIPDLNGRDFGDVMRLMWPAHKANKVIKQFRHTLETGRSCVVPEMIEQRLDRDAIEYFAWEIHRIPLPNGKFGVVCYFQDISERVLAQQAIVASEERYHTLFKCMDEGYCVVEMIFDAHHVTTDYRFLEVNPAFEAQSSLINATGKTILELIPDFNPGLIATYGQVALTGAPIRFEHHVPELNRWFDIYAFRIKTPQHNQLAILFNNITARKLAEFALVENEERLQAFVNSSADAIYCMSANWEQMHQVEGRNFVKEAKKSNANWLQDNIHPDDHLAIQERVSQAIQTKSIFEMEHRVFRLDNSVGWTYSRAVPLFNKQGEITEWFGTAADITERKNEQEKLRQSEERFRVLFELGPVAMYTVDAAGTIQEFNRNAINLWGREPQRGDPSESYCCAYRIYMPDGTYVPHAKNAVADVLQGRVSAAIDVEAILERQDGTRVSVVANVVPLLNDDGEIVGAMNCMVDMTYRKNIEDALISNNLELQTAKLAAEKANLAKSEFLSSMSHELRTPLNSILGFAQLIEAGTAPLTPTQMRNIQQILQAGWYLLALINEILDLAQIESGTQSITHEQVVVADVMQECATMIEPLALKHGVSTIFSTLAPNLCVHADRTRLKQIMINLLSNAVKYNKMGGTVIVDYIVSQTTLRICVIDTGAGLSAEQLTQLFQPFNRLGRQANIEEGTGIGLMVCKRLIELMDGKIGVQSTVDVGSKFWIELDLTSETTMPETTMPKSTPANSNKKRKDDR